MKVFSQKLTVFILSILSLFIIFQHQAVEATGQKDVGIWFSTWNTNEAKYDWLDGYGLGVTEKAVTDVNHDGKDDLFFYWDTPNVGFQGRLDIALSNGNGFNTPTTWIPTGSHRGANKNFFADVNGDKNADIIQYFARNPQECTWVVALSNGTGSFGAFQIWLSGFGCGSYEQFVSDTDGDGKADAVAFTNFNTNPAGIWYVSKSNGSGFVYSGTPWATNLGQGSGKRFLADVNGDKAADVVTFTNNAGGGFDGDWWSAQANGTNGAANAFINTNRWRTGYGYGSDYQMLGDVNADGKADAVVYYNNISPYKGAWYKELSTGNSFTQSVTSVNNTWKTDHGNWEKSKLRPAAWVTLANVDGDTVAGYSTQDPITFQEYYRNGTGIARWRVLPRGDTYNQPVQMNIWDAWEVSYRPLVNGIPSMYDTNDISTTDAQIAQIDAAGIDFMLFDLSNGVYDLTQNQGAHKWITQRAHSVCERIANYNASGHNMKFAVVGGAVQFSNPSNLSLVETEAQYVLNTFVNDPTCGHYYYNYHGKPLLGMYFRDTVQRDAWLNSYPHSASNNFTVKYAEGDLPNLVESGLAPPNYPSYYGASCGTVPTGANVKPGDYGNFLGWGFPYGTPGNGPIMVVQPGWYNKFNDINGNDNAATRKIARTNGGVSAGFYTNCSWSRVLANKSTTDLVIINSYNEYVEETAVAPTDTSLLTIPGISNNYVGGQWSNPNQYWNVTTSNIASFKN